MGEDGIERYAADESHAEVAVRWYDGILRQQSESHTYNRRLTLPVIFALVGSLAWLKEIAHPLAKDAALYHRAVKLKQLHIGDEREAVVSVLRCDSRALAPFLHPGCHRSSGLTDS